MKKPEIRGRLRFKLTDAVPQSEPAAEIPRGGMGRRGRDRIAPSEAALEQHNKEVNAGIDSNRERLVDIGRAGQSAGRQGS